MGKTLKSEVHEQRGTHSLPHSVNAVTARVEKSEGTEAEDASCTRSVLKNKVSTARTVLINTVLIFRFVSK